jgi:hypothetical protein
MAALAPMPSASVTTTVRARVPSRACSERMPTRMSCQSAAGRRASGRQTPRIESRDRRDVAELLQRGQARGLRILAALDPLLDLEGQVAADLVVEVAVVGRMGYSFPPATGS